ncbi:MULTISPECIES: hypothetical protein [Rhodopirellula]|uniref:hypothetical protein n=1 Tax=Rhodopirellula TaxID=265488 RepID=UPI0025811A41|nr:hypothetical protein [Rhodopirellula sp. UBA1907]
MDLTSVATTVLSSTVVVGICVFTLKLWIDRSMAASFAALEERLKAGIAEESRRTALSYDELGSTLKVCLSLLYRARNLARELFNNPDDLTARRGRQKLEILNTYTESIEDLMFENRALIPDNLFKMLHGAKGALSGFAHGIDELRKLRHRGEDDKFKDHVGVDLAQFYQFVDDAYNELTKEIQEFLHVSNSDS